MTSWTEAPGGESATCEKLYIPSTDIYRAIVQLAGNFVTSVVPHYLRPFTIIDIPWLVFSLASEAPMDRFVAQLPIVSIVRKNEAIEPLLIKVVLWRGDETLAHISSKNQQPLQFRNPGLDSRS